MDVSTLLQVAQTVLQLLDSSIMKEIESVWSFKSQLKKLKDTMSTIKAVLLDAERQEMQQVERSEADHDWLGKLRDVVFEADDLFDEVATLAQQGKLRNGNKVGKKVRSFVHNSKFAFNASREIKRIRERLDDMAKDRRDFGSSLVKHYVVTAADWSTMRRRPREETHSSVHDGDIVGRDKDKKAVIDMLLDSSHVEGNVSFITIVGIGGLGKTTLAQLAYNDERVDREFSLKLWVCVSDEFNVRAIVRGILESATKQNPGDLGMDLLQKSLREKIDGRKYLLVLDDVWNEDRQKWLQLRGLLVGGGRGSKIIVTTRSEIVGKIIGNSPVYKLEGLSEEDSWLLFEKMAFGERPERRDAELVEIGREIIRKCANVPLAIRVVGSLLYGHGKSKWLLFKKVDLASIRDNHNPIISILKLSYYHLASPLKSCFNYCAIFPKDYEIQKDILIGLWVAQGFILPSYGQNYEEVGEDYFMTLLQRCFFQDVTQDGGGEIVSCKIHDLMHDVAKEAAGSEIVVADSARSCFSGKIRHLSITSDFENGRVVHCLAETDTTRSFLKLRYHNLFGMSYDDAMHDPILYNTLVPKMRCLRVLDLHGSHGSQMEKLPSSMENLLHLRYLDISGNELEVLPASITKLVNLQTLKLNSCSRLKVLPRNLSNLVNLRCLEIEGCYSMTHMPPGMKILTCLRRLSMFVVAGANCGCGHVGQLEELAALTNLKGSLEIKLHKDPIFNGAKVKEAQFVRRMEHLKKISVDWEAEADEGDDSSGGGEALLEGLEPHLNLTHFSMCSYPGVKFPSWALLNNGGTPLSKLVELYLSSCNWLQHLPSFSRLPYLKTLSLKKLMELEYIECDPRSGQGGTDVSASSNGSTPETLFFPTLEKLELADLPKLKGWWRSLSFAPHSESESFPHLSFLTIASCPHLTSIPLCPNVEELEMIDAHEELRLIPSSSTNIINQLKRVVIDNVGYLNSLPVESLWGVSYLQIADNCNVDHFSTTEADVFRNRLSSLQSLAIWHCKSLKSLSGALEHLTMLETLELVFLPELYVHTSDDDDEPWKSLNQSLNTLTLSFLKILPELPKGMSNLTALRSLSIKYCSSFERLPEWIGCLSSLQTLKISDSPKLESLPDSMRNLTSLTQLDIRYCSDILVDRCKEPHGEDWPKIQHIPSLIIS